MGFRGAPAPLTKIHQPRRDAYTVECRLCGVLDGQHRDGLRAARASMTHVQFHNKGERL